MVNMDEISFWISTKRAPCLYENRRLVNKLKAKCHYFKDQINYRYMSCSDLTDGVAMKKKKRKKLSLSYETSSSRYHQFFVDRNSQVSSEESMNSISSEEAFFRKSLIKTTRHLQSYKCRHRKRKYHKNRHNEYFKPLPETITMFSMTQKHLKDTQTGNQITTNNSEDIYQSSLGENKKYKVRQGIYSAFTSQSTKIGRSIASKKHYETNNSASKENNDLSNTKAKKENSHPVDAVLDNVSDISGFTANYIRSTKSKLPKGKKKIRIIKNNQANHDSTFSKEPLKTKLVVNVNKSINAVEPHSFRTNACLNISTDSSNNILNLISEERGSVVNSGAVDKVNKSTSILRFLQPTFNKESFKDENVQQSNNKINTKQRLNDFLKEIKLFDEEVLLENEYCDSSNLDIIKLNQHDKGDFLSTEKQSDDIDKSELSRWLSNGSPYPHNYQSLVYQDIKRKELVKNVTSSKNFSKNLSTSPYNLDDSSGVLNVATGNGNLTQYNQLKNSLNVSGHILRKRSIAPIQSDHCFDKKFESAVMLQSVMSACKDKSGFSACFSDSDELKSPKKKGYFD